MEAGALAILGGECTENFVLQLLQQWPTLSQLTYRIWEYTDRIEITMEGKEGAVPEWEAIRSLERGRVFGEKGGDLSLRRDGDRFLWRFVGPAGTVAPEIGNPEDFWKTGKPGAAFYQNEETALLWGERREGSQTWFDSRAAKAVLRYPIDSRNRVQVKYRTYSHEGRLEFVWMTQLSKLD